NDKVYPVTSKIQRNIREPKGEMFFPLTADKASSFGLDKMIKKYDVLSTSSTITCNNGVYGHFDPISRTAGNHKSNHFSEITVTKNDGMRLVYGIPVYNNSQTDVTFNVHNTKDLTTNLVNYDPAEASTSNGSGTDHYFSKENIPAYATSFLLTGVCSPDYQDITGNGISDDDIGAAVKFNYCRPNQNYKWRTPGAVNENGSDRTNYANFSEGLKNPSAKDDKASFSYGTKELWYMNSIESKNMIAVFRLGDRDDAVGYNEDGSLDRSSRQKRLERIDLYTKAELLNNPTNPIPIKSVHFEYDYSLFKNIPNNIGGNGGGKLTLKSIYFTYANSNSGSENRYYFNYNASNDHKYDYQYQQFDRWGNFKDKDWNNTYNHVNIADNNEYPYSVQDKGKADEAAQKWQLSEIQLPSGGRINIEYESDDYAYVQNKRAMQMAPIIKVGSMTSEDGYQLSDKVFIKLPATTTSGELKWQYFDGIDQLYFKAMVDMKGSGTGEMVSGYAKIKSVKLVNSSGADVSSGDIACVTLEKRALYHPIAAASWQFLRQNLPQIAYPFSVNEDLSPLGFVKALVAAIGNIQEFFQPFESKAMLKGFGATLEPNKSFARINSNFMKYGGGLRVKKITIDDEWAHMAGSENGNNATSGMVFDYTKKILDPNTNSEVTISSGVASYEPMAGSDENPFHQPINYQQKQHLTTNIYTVEEPLGESYFPGPSVGYSQVTIRNLDAEGNVVNNGYTVKKFYTAKDFPTIVKRTDLSKSKYNQLSIFKLLSIENGNSVVLSQGYSIETNDMHGKPLSDETFDGQGKMLSGSYIHYKIKGTETMELDNNALTLHGDGTVQNDLIGEEFE
ncbi:MAG TPA: hypothetical protein VKH37_07515, partial [Ferruginibacter sp.]|nr:hypothetical protein [Ferruginibacter sp.]